MICDPFMLFFDSESAALTAGSLRLIDNIVAAKIQMPLRVIGYADAPGSERHNLALSLKRAEAVKRALVARGVPEGMILVGGRGETGFFVATNGPEAQNRRVQVSDCERM